MKYQQECSLIKTQTKQVKEGTWNQADDSVDSIISAAILLRSKCWKMSDVNQLRYAGFPVLSATSVAFSILPIQTTRRFDIYNILLHRSAF
jgi:hypothetical protein